MKTITLLILGSFLSVSAATEQPLLVTSLQSCQMSLNGHRIAWVDSGIQFDYQKKVLSWQHLNNGSQPPAKFELPSGETIKTVEVNPSKTMVFIATSSTKAIYDSHTGKKIADIGVVGNESTSPRTNLDFPMGGRGSTNMVATTVGSWSPKGYLVAFSFDSSRGGLYLQVYSSQTRRVFEGEALSYFNPIQKVIWAPNGYNFGLVTESHVPGYLILLLYDVRLGPMKSSLPIATNGISAGLGKKKKGKNARDDEEKIKPLFNPSAATENQIQEFMKGLTR
jgi:hypothetical protein